MIYSRIAGTGSYLPETRLTNADLEKLVDTTDEWILKRVGIRERRIVADSGDTTSSMAVAAAKAAMEAAGVGPEEIDLIIVGTATSDCFFPSSACMVQHSLGIKNECPAFDLNAACAGFIYGMSVADQYIKSGAAKHALVIGAESLSRVVDWKDRSTCILFGDGAGAVVLQSSDEPGIIHTNIHSDGQYGSMLYANSPLWDGGESPDLHMDGREVFKVAVSKLEEIVDQTLEQAGMTKSEIDWLIPHQANMRIIKATAKRLGLPIERVILTIEEHGNTSAASVPLALDSAVRQGQIKRGEVLMLEAFGAGFAWGSTLVKY
jgi:3-oxoacyl-[acyl-carrier-protein] synthase III